MKYRELSWVFDIAFNGAVAVLLYYLIDSGSPISQVPKENALPSAMVFFVLMCVFDYVFFWRRHRKPADEWEREHLYGEGDMTEKSVEDKNG